MNLQDIIEGGGVVLKAKKGASDNEEKKVKTKAKKATYIRGQHNSGSAKMKAEIRRKRANRKHK